MPAHAQRIDNLLSADKADAPCRVERRECDVRRGVRAAERGGAATWNSGSRGAHAERTRLEGWGGQSTRAERTRNMCFMFVTPNVLKLTGWLNFAAPCQVERRECESGEGAGRGRRGSWSVGQRQHKWRARGEDPTLNSEPRLEGWGGRARGRSAPETLISCV